MKGFLFMALLTASFAQTAFNINDCDVREIEFFDVSDEYPEGALTTERSPGLHTHDELIAALDALMTFSSREEIPDELRLVVHNLCLRIMYIK